MAQESGVASQWPGLHGFFGGDQALLKTAQACEMAGHCAQFFHCYLFSWTQPLHIFPKIVYDIHSAEWLKS